VPSEWLYHVNSELEAKIDMNSNKPKVAFLSTSERRYYPYDAGHSRLAMENKNTLLEEDIREPFIPANDDRLQKPIRLQLKENVEMLPFSVAFA